MKDITKTRPHAHIHACMYMYNCMYTHVCTYFLQLYYLLSQWLPCVPCTADIFSVSELVLLDFQQVQWVRQRRDQGVELLRLSLWPVKLCLSYQEQDSEKQKKYLSPKVHIHSMAIIIQLRMHLHELCT